MVYRDSNITFEELVKKDYSFTTHHRNLQHLAILMYKVKNNLAPKPVQEIFRVNLSDRANGDWVIPRVRTVNNGLEAVRYRGPIIWNLLPDEIKSAKTLQSFKNKVKLWKPQGCTCRICLFYLKGVGYIERPY